MGTLPSARREQLNLLARAKEPATPVTGMMANWEPVPPRHQSSTTQLWSVVAGLVQLPAKAELHRNDVPCICAKVPVSPDQHPDEHVMIRVFGLIDDLDLSVPNLVFGASNVSYNRYGRGEKRLCITVNRTVAVVQPTHLALVYGRIPPSRPYGAQYRFANPGKPGMIEIIDLDRAYQEYVRLAA